MYVLISNFRMLHSSTQAVMGNMLDLIWKYWTHSQATTHLGMINRYPGRYSSGNHYKKGTKDTKYRCIICYLV